MGKPFQSELLAISETVKWANLIDINLLKKEISNLDFPVYFVGSGGSLSACYLGVSIVEKKGKFAKAITPLELFALKNTIRNSTIIIISASGRNTDILFAFKMAVKFDAKSILSICMVENSKLSELSHKFTRSKIFEYKLPVGKDGFLATNSLVSYFIILIRALTENKQIYNKAISKTNLEEIEAFCNTVNLDSSITVLYNGWTKSIAYDIESKSIEAALYPILLADFRNFGHGRHHWFAKKVNKSAIIAIATPEDEIIANKTLAALPSTIPKLIIKTNFSSDEGLLDLLIKSFQLINNFGQSFGIDPGKPGVPEFGRKLYNLKYQSLLKINKSLKQKITSRALISIERKINLSIDQIDDDRVIEWIAAYKNFISKLNKTNFGAIIFDYDGTLCAVERKFNGPDKVISEKLTSILENGFIIGIATGRGKSVKADLRKVLPERLWPQVLIGYYNCSDIGLLSDNRHPNRDKQIDVELIKLHKLITAKYNHIRCDLRPKQLTVKHQENSEITNVIEQVKDSIMNWGIKNVQVLESSHSIDIIPLEISKIDIFNPLKDMLKKSGLSTEILCIGDRGRWPGNDYKLLATEYSLSVDETSFEKDTCWNIASMGVSHTDATIEYLDKLSFGEKAMKLKVN